MLFHPSSRAHVRSKLRKLHHRDIEAVEAKGTAYDDGPSVQLEPGPTTGRAGMGGLVCAIAGLLFFPLRMPFLASWGGLRWTVSVGDGTAQRVSHVVVLRDVPKDPEEGLRWSAYAGGGTAQRVPHVGALRDIPALLREGGDRPRHCRALVPFLSCHGDVQR